MGYVCDQWNCFAVVNPKLHKLMKQWEGGGIILKPFIFDIMILPKEFNAYPGGRITEVKRVGGTKRVFVPAEVKKRLEAVAPVRLVSCQG